MKKKITNAGHFTHFSIISSWHIFKRKWSSSATSRLPKLKAHLTERWTIPSNALLFLPPPPTHSFLLTSHCRYVCNLGNVLKKVVQLWCAICKNAPYFSTPFQQMFWIFDRRTCWLFKYIASVGIGKTKWMRCLTFSDLSSGNEFAGGPRGRDQQCVELSLQLFKCCRAELSIGPLPRLLGQKWLRKEMERETSAGRYRLLSSVVG